MKAKIISIILALAVCASLTAPAFAVENAQTLTARNDNSDDVVFSISNCIESNNLREKDADKANSIIHNLYIAYAPSTITIPSLRFCDLMFPPYGMPGSRLFKLNVNLSGYDGFIDWLNKPVTLDEIRSQWTDVPISTGERFVEYDGGDFVVITVNDGSTFVLNEGTYVFSTDRDFIDYCIIVLGENESTIPPAPITGEPIPNISRTMCYWNGQYTDVDESQWYGYDNQRSIALAYEYRLMQGDTFFTFNPTGNLTLAEAITIAAKLRFEYNDDNRWFELGDPWYQVYVDYAVENNIIKAGDFSNYDREATRAEMAYIFSRSVPPSLFTKQNAVMSLPDVDANTPYADAITTLYEAGVLSGNDASGTFNPNTKIIRAEAAAIITRVILPDLRINGKTYGG